MWSILSFKSVTNLQEISVSNLNSNKSIQFWIAKDTSVHIQSFEYINVTSLLNLNQSSNPTSFSFKNGLLSSGFKINVSNVSIHIQIKPENKSRAYISLVKFGQNPSTKDYDLINFFSPIDLLIMTEMNLSI